MSDELAPVAEPEPASEPVEAPPAAPTPEDADAAELAALETGAIEVPEGDGIVKLVPLAAVKKAREEAKSLRGEAKRATELSAELERVRADLAAAAPFVEAAKALLQQPQPAQPTDTGPSPEERAELEEIARDLDFYKDGGLDLERASRHQARVRKEAERMAAATMAPLQQDAMISRAKSVLEQAKSWKDPVTGEQADPKILANLWNHIAKQPGGLQTLTNPETAAVYWGQGINLTRWQKGKGPVPAATPAPSGPPVFVEPAGGNTTGPALSAMERRLAKDMGMTEAEYLKEAARAPKGM